MLSQITQAVGAALTTMAVFLPKFVAFLIVLLVGWLIAKAIGRGLDAILQRAGFDRLVERGGVKKALARSRYDASTLLSKIVYYIVMLFVFQLAFGVFGPNPVSVMLNRIVAYLPNVFAAGVIVVVGAAIAAAVADIISAALGGMSWGKAVATAASISILTVTIFAALDQLNIAPAIVTGLFYAILAIVVGVSVVALGGAGIQPMRDYWFRMLGRIDREMPAAAEAARNAPQAVKERAQQRQQQAREVVGTARGGTGKGSRREQPTGF